jgi:hypothetical protein
MRGVARRVLFRGNAGRDVNKEGGQPIRGREMKHVPFFHFTLESRYASSRL